MTLDDMFQALEFSGFSFTAMTISFAIHRLQLQLKFEAYALQRFQSLLSNCKMALCIARPSQDAILWLSTAVELPCSLKDRVTHCFLLKQTKNLKIMD